MTCLTSRSIRIHTALHQLLLMKLMLLVLLLGELSHEDLLLLTVQSTLLIGHCLSLGGLTPYLWQILDGPWWLNTILSVDLGLRRRQVLLRILLLVSK